MPTLYGAPVSPFVRKTIVALAEKGIAYEHDPVLPAVAPAEFKRISKEISPLGRIPAYRDGDLTLADSSVIIAYLERVKPSPALYPSEPHDYARALWFEEYGDGGLAPIVGAKIFFQKIAARHFSSSRPMRRWSTRLSTKNCRHCSIISRVSSQPAIGW